MCCLGRVLCLAPILVSTMRLWKPYLQIAFQGGKGGAIGRPFVFNLQQQWLLHSCHETCAEMADFMHQSVHNAHMQQYYAHVTVLTCVHLSLETIHDHVAAHKWCSGQAAWCASNIHLHAHAKSCPCPASCHLRLSSLILHVDCSLLYTTKAIVNSMASGLGPLVSVVLFAFLGNTWKVRHFYWLVMAWQW